MVDDVIANVLPRYATDARPPEEQYASDVRRILVAFETDSSERRRRIEKALSVTPFVAAFDAASKKTVFARPGDVYIASHRLRELFEGVGGVLLVSNVPALRTEQGRNMLIAAGAARYLTAKACRRKFSHTELSEMRKNAGYAQNTGLAEVDDFTLRGLDGLLELLPDLHPTDARRKASLLWEALCDLEERSGHSAFEGTYRWFYFQPRSCSFDATYVERLRTFEWIAGSDGNLHSPAETSFDELSWRQNHALVERLKFKPRHLDQLALDSGFEPQVLSLLKKYGLTTGAQLQALLDQYTHGGEPDETHHGDDRADDHPDLEEGSRYEDVDQTVSDERPASKIGGPSGRVQRKPFTYVQVRAEDAGTEGGDDAQAARMELEERGIQLILANEPVLQRTPANNPGFDLVEKDAADRELRWVEVKAISDAFDNRWVGLSREQFETAMHRQEDYWLYVVEHAATPDLAKIIKIQNPAGQAKTFAFDHGWQSLATEGP